MQIKRKGSETMRRKFAWFLVTGLTALFLLLASCAPAASPTTTTTVPPNETTPATETVPPKETTPPPPTEEKPKYGGTLALALPSWTYGWDEAYAGSLNDPYVYRMPYDPLILGDWAKGPAGTGEASWTVGIVPDARTNLMTGFIAENFELPDDHTMIFHIRQGVHFQNKPPTNGRELDATDVAFSIMRQYYNPADNFKTPNSKTFQGLVYAPPTGIISANATDKWTVVVTTFPGQSGNNLAALAGLISIQAKDNVQAWGDVTDWRHVLGTGPFLLTDFVPSSSMTFNRNPNYWLKNPVGPGKGDQLPYMDGIKLLIIPDVSTRTAALRTAKLDMLGSGGGETKASQVKLDDFLTLRKTNPELKWSKVSSSVAAIQMRVDKPELPFSDIRVRRALAMAVNQPGILKDYYQGEAMLTGELVAPVPEFKDIYTPIEEMPEDVREQFEYHPDKAKQLLADAGYPKGFTTQVVLTTSDVDLASIVVANWKDIGVTLNLDVKEVGVYNSIAAAASHPEMLWGSASPNFPNAFHKWRDPVTGGGRTPSMVADARLEADHQLAALNANIGDYSLFVKGIKDAVPYGMSLALAVYLPAPYDYSMWWPWVKNFRGEFNLGNSYPAFVRYIWLDQDLKQKMGH